MCVRFEMAPFDAVYMQVSKLATGMGGRKSSLPLPHTQIMTDQQQLEKLTLQYPAIALQQ